jgi:hypothetical protein
VDKKLFIRICTNTEKDFYEQLGPFIGKRDIHKEIGIAIYDDNNKLWAIAKMNGLVVGFASKRGKIISDCYVKKEHRQKGILTEILNEICNEKELKATCTQMSKGAFEKIGFIAKKETKKFTYMERKNA